MGVIENYEENVEEITKEISTLQHSNLEKASLIANLKREINSITSIRHNFNIKRDRYLILDMTDKYELDININDLELFNVQLTINRVIFSYRYKGNKLQKISNFIEPEDFIFISEKIITSLENEAKRLDEKYDMLLKIKKALEE